MKRYTKEAATATAEKACAQLKGEASYKLFERDKRYGAGWMFIAASGSVSIKSTQPGRFSARYTGLLRGISSECIDEDGETIGAALHALRSHLYTKQRHMCEALGIIDEQPEPVSM